MLGTIILTIVIVVLILLIWYYWPSSEGYKADKRAWYVHKPMPARVIPFHPGALTLSQCRPPGTYVDQYGYEHAYLNLEDISDIAYV